MWFWARREINDWRDGWALAAAETLHELSTQLAEDADETIRSAPGRELLVAPSGFIARRLEPSIRAVADPIVAELLERADNSLRRILGDRAARLPGNDPARASAVAVVHEAAVNPWFVQVAGEAIRWPVSVVGDAVADAAVATGLLDRPGVREGLEKRLRAEARTQITAVLLRGTAKQPALLEQVTACLRDAAKRAKRL